MGNQRGNKNFGLRNNPGISECPTMKIVAEQFQHPTVHSPYLFIVLQTYYRGQKKGVLDGNFDDGKAVLRYG